VRGRQTGIDDQGHYYIGHLAPGTYSVSVIARPWYARHSIARPGRPADANSNNASDEVSAGNAAVDVAYPVTFFSNATDFNEASPITLHPGDAETADITLHPVPAVHLTLRSYSPDPSERLSVQSVSQYVADGVEQNLAVLWQGRSDSSTIELTGLPPGRLNLSWTSSKGDESTPHSMSVQAAGDAELNSSDGPQAASITGVIQMDDGSSLAAGTHVVLRHAATGSSFITRLEQSGEFTFAGQPAAAGTYDMLLQPAATEIRSISATGAKVAGHTVEITSGQDVRLNVVATKGSGTVTGFALKEGKPRTA
jgi:hypothetical protein